MTGEVVKEEGSLVAVNSRLGWLLSGPIDLQDVAPAQHMNIVISGTPICDTRNDILHHSLSNFWELESLGIVDVPVKSKTSYSFVPSISCNENHYSVSLPWKDDHAEIPVHLALCESRLRGLLRRLQNTPDLLLEYNKIIQDQIAKLWR